MRIVTSLVGQKFGQLEVVAQDFERSTPGRVYYRVQCACGKFSSARSDGLTSGKHVSCGCGKKEHGLRHGHRRRGTSDPTYASWDGMVQRCTNPKTPMYKHYGARGITVPKRWLTFENFLADMGCRPAGKTLERKDSNRGYSKGNCVWAAQSEQMLNTRRTVKVLYLGKQLPLVVVTRTLGVKDAHVRYRLRLGWTPAQILKESLR